MSFHLWFHLWLFLKFVFLGDFLGDLVLDLAFRLTFLSFLALVRKVMHSMSRISCTWLILTLNFPSTLLLSLNWSTKSSSHKGSYIRTCLCNSWSWRIKLSKFSWMLLSLISSLGSSSLLTTMDSSGKSSETVEILLSWESDSSSWIEILWDWVEIRIWCTEVLNRVQYQSA